VGYAEQQNKLNDIEAEYRRVSKRYASMRSAAITGGEPLLFIDDCVSFIKYAKKRHPSVQTRIYTNGDLATEAVLAKLQQAGLDEIRFGLKPDELGVVSDTMYQNLETAVKYIPRAMVGMPAQPNQLSAMIDILDRLDSIGIYGINLLEFLYPWQHAAEYAKAGFAVSPEPYRVLYDYDYAGGVPVAGSELCCLELLKHAAEHKFRMGVHYCSLENKLTAQVWHHNQSFKKTALEYFSPKDFFVKTAKAYGKDADAVRNVLDQHGVSHYNYNQAKSIEFSLSDIELLRGMNIELGVSVMIMDYDDKQRFVREVAVHYTDTESFSMDDV
jgi:pyruvate formate-lyase activating enzyme-like uncharacterized protein